MLLPQTEELMEWLELWISGIYHAHVVFTQYQKRVATFKFFLWIFTLKCKVYDSFQICALGNISKWKNCNKSYLERKRLRNIPGIFFWFFFHWFCLSFVFFWRRKFLKLFLDYCGTHFLNKLQILQNICTMMIPPRRVYLSRILSTCPNNPAIRTSSPLVVEWNSTKMFENSCAHFISILRQNLQTNWGIFLSM